MLHFKGFAMMIELATMYCFCSHIQSLVELESVIVATTPYFEHTTPLTYSLCAFVSAHWCKEKNCIFTYFDDLEVYS